MWSAANRLCSPKRVWIGVNLMGFCANQRHNIKSVFDEVFCPYSPALTKEGALPDQDKWEIISKDNPDYVFREDPRYPALFEKFINTPIKRLLQPTLKEAGIREDLYIYERDEYGIQATAAGTNSYKKRVPSIILSRNFFDIDPEACAFVCKHEISHIKNDDSVNETVTNMISYAAAIGFSYYRSFSPLNSLYLGVAAAWTCYILHGQYAERRADDFAIQSSTDEELLGGLRTFKAFKIQKENSVPAVRLTIDSETYELPFVDLTHPDPSSRIEKVERALAQRKVVVDPAVEGPKLDKLVEYDTSLKEHYIEKYAKEALIN